MKRVACSVVACLVLGAVLLTFCLMPLAAAPKPIPPAPAPAAPYVPTQTGHEAYPYSGNPPQGHEQATIFNSFTSTQQQGLYSRFAGFGQDYL